MSDDRRAAVEAAFEQLENPEPEPVEPVEAAPEPAPEPAQAEKEAAPSDEPKTRPFGQDKTRDESGKFTKTKTPTPGKPVVTAKPTATAKPVAQTATPVPEAAKPTATQFKAPQSWSQVAKEKWASAPAEIQAEVAKREKEIVQKLQEFAPVKQRDEAVRQAIEPFLPMFQAQNAHPLTAIAGVLRTVQALTYGTPEQRAQIHASLFKSYPVPIEMLAQQLDAAQSQTPQPQQQYQQPQQFRDPRVDQMLQQREQHLASQGQQAVEEFASNAEFMDNEDVRAAMADALELAANKGRTLTLEQAHQLALGLNPDIQEALAQRKLAEAANAVQASTQRSKRAASSLRSEPGGMQQQATPTGRRAHIEAAFNTHNQ